MGGNDNYSPIYTNIDWCKGCELCISFCPRKVLTLNLGKVEVRNPENCIKCGLCEQLCPDYAIRVRRD